MLLRALGVLVLSTGVAVAQAPAERPSSPTRRDTGADRGRAGAQTPAERASRSLERDMRGDRFRDAAVDARDGTSRPTRPEVQQFEPQRRSLQPDVGRPEQQGLISPRSTPGVSGVGTNEQR